MRSRASALVTQPRSAPIPFAVRAKPIAAMLENGRDGARAAVSPVRGSVSSQNHWNVRASSVSRKGSKCSGSCAFRSGGRSPHAERSVTKAASRVAVLIAG